jgi:hypothetical protein
LTIGRLRIALGGIGLLLTFALPVGAQDLDRGKTPPQLFSSNCTACHRGPQGLFRGSVAGTASFLRQHYTTSAESAGALAAYLASVGGDPRTARIRMPSDGPDGDARQERREGEERREAGESPAASARRKPGEPAVVANDPPNIITAPEPVPLAPSRLAVRQAPPAPQTAQAPAPSVANNTSAPAPPEATSMPEAAKPSDEEIAAQEGFSSPLP